MELDQYIQNQYPNVAALCNMCNRLCLRGQTCDRCDVKLHLHCAQRYFGRNDHPVCPGPTCNAPWTHPIPQSKAKETASSQAQGRASETAWAREDTQNRKRKGRRYDT